MFFSCVLQDDGVSFRAEKADSQCFYTVSVPICATIGDRSDPFGVAPFGGFWTF